MGGFSLYPAGAGRSLGQAEEGVQANLQHHLGWRRPIARSSSHSGESVCQCGAVWDTQLDDQTQQSSVHATSVCLGCCITLVWGSASSLSCSLCLDSGGVYSLTASETIIKPTFFVKQCALAGYILSWLRLGFETSIHCAAQLILII